MAIINELITRLTWQGTVDPINTYTKGLTGAINMLGAFTGLQGLFAGGIAAMTMRVVDQADALGDLSIRTGVSAEAIQKLNYAAIMNGSSTEAMTSSLEGLNRQIGLAAQGEKAQSDTFKELGISVKDAEGKVKSADVVFAEMQKSLSGKSVQEVAGYLRKLRLDPTLAQTLGLTAEEMTKLNKEAEGFGIMTQEQIDQAQAFNDSLDQLKFGMDGFTNQMMLSVAPSILEGIEIFKEFLSANKELLQSGLSAVVGFISGAFHILKSLWQTIDGLAGAMGGWSTVLVMASAAVLTLNRAMLKNPAVWWTIAIGGVILIIDDLVTAFNGGQSAIATFFDEMFGIDIVNVLVKGLNGLQMALATIATGLLTVGKLFLEAWSAGVKFANFMGAGIDTKGLDAHIKAYSDVQKQVAMVAIGESGMTAPRPAMMGSTANTTQNNQVTVNVTGASDPQKTADLTSKAVQREVQAAKVNGTRGGR